MEKKLIFLHNSRCTGNSLDTYIVEAFGYGDKVIKSGEAGKDFHDYPYILENINNPNVRFVLGHNVFGLHRHVQDDFEYFTNVRDPVKRLISGYSAWVGEQGKTITDWLNHQSFELNNGIVKRLCGYGKLNNRVYDFTRDRYVEDILVPDESFLEKAIRNIEKYHGTILFTEMFIESLLLFEERYGLLPLFSLTKNYYNQSKLKLAEDEVDPAVVEYIRENNHLDYQLYDYLKGNFIREIASRPKEFHERVRIRKILSSMLKVPGKDILSGRNFEEAFYRGVNKLLFFGMIDELVEILKLIIAKNNVTRPLSENIIHSVSAAIPKESIEELIHISESKEA